MSPSTEVTLDSIVDSPSSSSMTFPSPQRLPSSLPDNLSVIESQNELSFPNQADQSGVSISPTFDEGGHHLHDLAQNHVNKDDASDCDSLNRDVCSICMMEIVDGEKVGALSCNHLFHVDCLKEWIKRKNSCPLCQSPNIASIKTSNSSRNVFSSQRTINDARDNGERLLHRPISVWSRLRRSSENIDDDNSAAATYNPSTLGFITSPRTRREILLGDAQMRSNGRTIVVRVSSPQSRRNRTIGTTRVRQGPGIVG